jgi:hypothetical protein
MRQWFLNFWAEKKFLLASLKTVAKNKDCTESRISIFVPAFVCCH